MIISTDLSAPGLAEVSDEGADAAPECETRAIAFLPAHQGLRLDQALAVLVPEFSRSYLQQLIAQGAVRLGEAVVERPSLRVKAGERGSVELRATAQSRAFLPQSMELRVVHEDDALLVVDKPAGLVVHPAPGNWSGTLLNGLLARDPRAADLPRAGIVHRLDKDTSGLMVVARNRLAMDALVRAIAARTVRREYLALAHRPWNGPRQRRAEGAIGRDPRNRLRMAVVDLARHAGKPAATGFELLENAAEGCWLRCLLETGRTHQIRVHLAALGHPIVADALYGGVPAAGMARQALHAFRLDFTHPSTGQALSFQSGLPDDLCGALRAWGLAGADPRLQFPAAA